ncbi:phosphate/phosphite/phosphonate ABC transporter substrate-binding protein [Oceanimonas sp. NS1]|nr:phosphate/phosphite/phosphonate ABC transporter substrate-binding protein [Oceanimonas sp. NS1]
MDALIYLLRDGALDAVMVPACTLEQMMEEGLVARQDFRVLMLQADTPCARSTPLYPGWSFAAAGINDETLLRNITQVLLAMKQDGRALWGRPFAWMKWSDCCKTGVWGRKSPRRYDSCAPCCWIIGNGWQG